MPQVNLTTRAYLDFYCLCIEMPYFPCAVAPSTAKGQNIMKGSDAVDEFPR